MGIGVLQVPEDTNCRAVKNTCLYSRSGIESTMNCPSIPPQKLGCNIKDATATTRNTGQTCAARPIVHFDGESKRQPSHGSKESNMKKVKLTIPSNIEHTAQIITGFLMLREQGWNVEIENRSRDKSVPFHGLPALFAQYRGKTLFYDVWDGYQDPPDMLLAIKQCDFYFKRSFSRGKNQEFFGADASRVYPLGFNYHVTHPNNPVGEPMWKAVLRPLQGKTPARYFTPKIFEGNGNAPCGDPPKILFLARLWGREAWLEGDPANDEREAISHTRIEIIRALRETYGSSFIGGINDCPLSRELAPDLIVPKELTERRRYLDAVHSSDICIGSTGLHQSIGWKTGEYVAAAKAIVHEELRYSVPGDFREGVNYLSFRTAQECVDAVAELVRSPDRIQAMKRANADYYQQYLRPDVLVKNTLSIVDQALDG